MNRDHKQKFNRVFIALGDDDELVFSYIGKGISATVECKNIETAMQEIVGCEGIAIWVRSSSIDFPDEYTKEPWLLDLCNLISSHLFQLHSDPSPRVP